MSCSVNISLKQIIQRRIDYYINDKTEDLLASNSGYVRGFEQMLADIDMVEVEFIEKYTNLTKQVQTDIMFYDNDNMDNKVVDELCGYNNAIVDILSLLDLKLMYDN